MEAQVQREAKEVKVRDKEAGGGGMEVKVSSQDWIGLIVVALRLPEQTQELLHLGDLHLWTFGQLLALLLLVDTQGQRQNQLGQMQNIKRNTDMTRGRKEFQNRKVQHMYV